MKRILLEIVRIGLLRARASGWDEDSDRCAMEADHFHNLPGLILNPNLEQMLYYYNFERNNFSRRARSVDQFEEAWKNLGALLIEKWTSKPTTAG